MALLLFSHRTSGFIMKRRGLLFISVRSPLWGVSTLGATSDALLSPCLNIETVFCHIVVRCSFICFVFFSSGLLHNAAAWKLPQDWKISAEKGDDQFLREHRLPPHHHLRLPLISKSLHPRPPHPLTAPWPLHLLLLTSTSHNYFAKELQKKEHAE